ncbi:hypothetical protein [Lujinxingia litoralis]|uniref:hypothetical protein n=1 Tax=Lujinxingia litoralis TaxID=2211119 RepID=UPI0011B94719|nr:hypothetical protein [Lujinxingia litoralis]
MGHAPAPLPHCLAGALFPLCRANRHLHKRNLQTPGVIKAPLNDVLPIDIVDAHRRARLPLPPTVQATL